MKTKVLIIFILLLFIALNTFGPECVSSELSSTISGVPIDSKNGATLPASGTIRILLVLADVNYDVGTDPHGPPADWLPGQLPPWINSFLDVNAPSTGSLTNYFNVASSGNYTVLEDFLKPTTGTGVFTINTI